MTILKEAKSWFVIGILGICFPRAVTNLMLPTLLLMTQPSHDIPSVENVQIGYMVPRLVWGPCTHFSLQECHVRAGCMSSFQILRSLDFAIGD